VRRGATQCASPATHPPRYVLISLPRPRAECHDGLVLQEAGEQASPTRPAVGEALPSHDPRPQEDEKKLAEDRDDGYLGAKWADPKALKSEVRCHALREVGCAHQLALSSSVYCTSLLYSCLGQHLLAGRAGQAAADEYMEIVASAVAELPVRTRAPERCAGSCPQESYLILSTKDMPPITATLIIILSIGVCRRSRLLNLSPRSSGDNVTDEANSVFTS